VLFDILFAMKRYFLLVWLYRLIYTVGHPCATLTLVQRKTFPESTEIYVKRVILRPLSMSRDRKDKAGFLPGSRSKEDCSRWRR